MIDQWRKEDDAQTAPATRLFEVDEVVAEMG